MIRSFYHKNFFGLPSKSIVFIALMLAIGLFFLAGSVASETSKK